LDSHDSSENIQSADDRNKNLTASDQPANEAAGQEPETIKAWLAVNGPILVIMAVVAIAILKFGGWETLLGCFYVMVGLGVVIFLHELGHFAVAKWCDVHVETFSIGFGPALPGCRFQKGETTYMIAVFPLGGYVKMLGEGAEDDPEGDANPRSFKNKSVPARMAIISAGVIMNLILGCLCFIFVYRVHGDEQIVAAVGDVDAGSPAASVGLQTDDNILRIGDVKDPSFEELRSVVPLSGQGELVIVFGRPGGPEIQTTITPRRSADQKMQVIGIRPAPALELPKTKMPELESPTFANSPARKANPPFEFGDKIIGMTDPDDPEKKVTPLPPNRHNKQSPFCDYFAFRERLAKLNGRKVVIRVERTDDAGQQKQEDITIEPAYHYQLGLRMKMGRVEAVRKLKDDKDNPVMVGDSIKRVEVDEPGRFASRWVVDRSPMTPLGYSSLAGLAAEPSSLAWANLAAYAGVAPTITNGVMEMDLDPVRLPFELKQWAGRTAGERKVKFTVGRTKRQQEDQSESVVVPWNDDFRFAEEAPFTLASPMSIPELGIAYQVSTTVDGVVPGSPAARGSMGKMREPPPPDRPLLARLYTSPWVLALAASLAVLLLGWVQSKDRRFAIGTVVTACLLVGLCLYQLFRPETATEQFVHSVPFQWQKGDVITAVRRFQVNKDGKVEPDKNPTKLDKHPMGWAHIFYVFQLEGTQAKQLSFRVERGSDVLDDIVVVAEPDNDWPRAERGLMIGGADTRLKKADSWGQALQWGFDKTKKFIEMVYKMLFRLGTGDISPDQIGGPIMIFHVGFSILQFHDVYKFIFFLGMISVNLAVINFLPIPVLDGGHFVFLLYEGLRGKPAPEKVRIATTYVGLLLIVSLMLFVIIMDVKRYLPGWFS
jgi:regulator of sigma E protease